MWLVAAFVLAGCQTVPPLALPPAAPASASSAASSPLPYDTAASAPIVLLPPAAVARPPRIGLALGGGAARGFAHIGVLQVLEENGIRPALVVGTSAGSLVAALYAAGNSPRDLATLAKTMDETAFNDWSYPGRGLFRGAALAQYVRDHAHGRDMEHMTLPLGIVATDLDSGAPVLFQRGDPGVAVRASSAVPAVFQPVKIGTREYVDGGLVSPVPVRFARQMGADLVIAVDISSPPDGNATGDAFHLLLQTFSIMGRSINTWELKDADVVIRPALAKVASSDFTGRAQSIQAGRAAATAALADLRVRIAARTR